MTGVLDLLLDVLKVIVGMVVVAVLIYGRIKWFEYLEEQHPE